MTEAQDGMAITRVTHYRRVPMFTSVKLFAVQAKYLLIKEQLLWFDSMTPIILLTVSIQASGIMPAQRLKYWSLINCPAPLTVTGTEKNAVKTEKNSRL